MRDSFTFYRSFVEGIKELDAETCKKLLVALADYALDDEMPDLKGVEKALFLAWKPNIDASNRRKDNGLKGGRPAKSDTTEEPNETELNRTKPNLTELNRTEPNKTELPEIEIEEEKEIEEKEIEKKEKPTLQSLLDESALSDPVKEEMRKWVQYKRERREGYKETGFRSLLTRVMNEERKRGPAVVISLIELSMSNQYKGIIWDKQEVARSGTNPFSQIRQQNYDFGAIEKALEEV